MKTQGNIILRGYDKKLIWATVEKYRRFASLLGINCKLQQQYSKSDLGSEEYSVRVHFYNKKEVNNDG